MLHLLRCAAFLLSFTLIHFNLPSVFLDPKNFTEMLNNHFPDVRICCVSSLHLDTQRAKHNLIAKMTFTTSFNEYALSLSLIKEDKNAYSPTAIMVSFHLSMQFLWKFLHFSISWPYEGTGSFSTTTGEFVCVCGCCLRTEEEHMVSVGEKGKVT